MKPEHKVANQKQRKNKAKKEKKAKKSKTVNAGQDNIQLVNTEEAKAIIATAGSKPVILIFFSPSKLI